MVLNSIFNAFNRHFAHPSDDITQSQSFEASQGIAETIAVEESPENKATEMAHALDQSLDHQRQVSSPFRLRPHQESSPVAISSGQTSYDHADEQMTNDTEYRHFLHQLRGHRAPLSESTLAREEQHYRVARGECVVGSPKNGHRTTLLLPGVIPIINDFDDFEIVGDEEVTLELLNEHLSTGILQSDAVNKAATDEDGMIFDMDFDEETENEHFYRQMFTSITNIPQLADETLPARVKEDVVDAQVATSVPEDRQEILRQLAVNLRQISADFSRSRRPLQLSANAQPKISSTFLVHFFDYLRAFAFRIFFWLLHRP